VGRLEGILVGLTMSMLCGQSVGAMVAEESETADVVRKAQCGIVVKPGDVESIRSAILHLKENPPAREAMGRNGRAYLERNMSLEKNVALYEEIFHALAGMGSSRGERFLRGARMRRGLGTMGCGGNNL